MTFGDFTLASGERSTYYIDARRTTMSAHGLQLIGELALLAIREEGWCATGVGGLTMGADPVAYALALASATSPPLLDAFSVRKTTKDHGTQRQIEGNLPERGGSVIVVEDVITSGGSAIRAIEAVVRAGCSVAGVLAVVDREAGGKEAIEQTGHPVIALTSASSILDIGRK